MEQFGNKDTKHEGKGDNKVDGGLESQGPRASATAMLAQRGFERFTSSVPMTTHSISSDCGGLLEGNSGVDTSGWVE